MAFEFFENEAVVRFLEASIEENKLLHAYLFYGDIGVGKKFIARQFAAAILCYENNSLCNMCSSCLKFKNGVHPDYFEIGTDSGKIGQSFGIDDVRGLIENSQIKPNDGKYKVFLIKNIDNIKASAANAFLKVLEAPPDGVIFLMTATDIFNVFDTISSRCVKLSVNGLSELLLKKILRKKFYSVSEKALMEAVTFCGGSFEKAVFYISNPVGRSVIEFSKALKNACFEQDELELIKITAKLGGDVDLIFKVLSCLENMLHSDLKSSAQIGEIEGNEYFFNLILKILNSIYITKNILRNSGNIQLTTARFCCEILN